MVAPDDRIRTGMKVEPGFASFFVFRDNELLHRSITASDDAETRALLQV